MARDPNSTNASVDLAATWLSRVITILLIMVGPGLLGAYLDRRWQTGWLMPTGFVVGTMLGIAGLLLLSAVHPIPDGDPTKYVPFEDTDDRSDGAQDERRDDDAK